MAHRIDTSTAQKDKFGVGKNGFTRGNPQTGVPATELDDDYFDMLQEEIVGIVEAAGDTLDKTKRNQLNAALGKLFQNKTGASSALGALVPAANRLPYFTGANGASLTDLTSVGRDILASATKTAVLEYLGLGDLGKAGDTEVEAGANFITAKIPFISTTTGTKKYLMIHAITSTMPSNNNGYSLTITYPTAYDVSPFPFLSSTVGLTSTSGGTSEGMTVQTIAASSCVVLSAWQSWTSTPIYLFTVGVVTA